MKLFYKPGACSLAPHIVLEELGIGYESEKVDLKTKVTESGSDFLTINPKGYVPALQMDNGEVLTECQVILEYLGDQNPSKGLMPEFGSAARYQTQAWLNFVATEVHKPFSPFFNPAAPQAWKDISLANIEKRLSYVETELSGKDYLMGDTFTVADAYLFTVLGWGKYIQLDLAKWPNLTAYQARVAQRPAIIAALKAEGLI
ncbi:glutathione transferase GstA [Advenella sp. RU8]|uniref:glutathione transferase GstA n=1 Tax=Advenella sp. RU8 TaxID=3399575 RepID=UPI003AAE79E8